MRDRSDDPSHHERTLYHEATSRSLVHEKIVGNERTMYGCSTSIHFVVNNGGMIRFWDVNNNYHILMRSLKAHLSWPQLRSPVKGTGNPPYLTDSL